MIELQDNNDKYIAGEGDLVSTKTITFIVTEDCQLRCKYCYIVGKNNFNRMSIDTAKSAIDYVLSNNDFAGEQSVVWDFIGGEPFMEIRLITQICDYIKERMFILNHPWFNNYRFNFSTNGVNYSDPLVQQFIESNITHLSIGISLDGTLEKHDLNRVFPTGKGSYFEIVKNVPLWLKQFPDASTKATVSHTDLIYIKDSVINLWNLGIRTVNMNVVFEDVWSEGDDEILEAQLIGLADYVVGNKLYPEYSCSFFDMNIGQTIEREFDNQNWCGAGKMLAIDPHGNFYPCMRFAAYSLTNHPPIIIGNTKMGIDSNKLRPFLSLTRSAQSSEECMNCEVASGCAWCVGFNYDSASTPTIFQRAIFLCKLHKARVRANNYFWDRLKFANKF